MLAIKDSWPSKSLRNQDTISTKNPLPPSRFTELQEPLATKQIYRLTRTLTTDTFLNNSEAIKTQKHIGIYTQKHIGIYAQKQF